MAELEPAPTFAGAITVTAIAHAVHPEGTDLNERPVPSSGADNEKTETI